MPIVLHVSLDSIFLIPSQISFVLLLLCPRLADHELFILIYLLTLIVQSFSLLFFSVLSVYLTNLKDATLPLWFVVSNGYVTCIRLMT